LKIMATPARKKSSDLEAWENVSRSRYALQRINSRGDITTDLIGGQRTFHLSPEERYMNSELASSPKVDPFKNGRFAPVRLLETTEDAEEIASNPNLMGESEIKALVTGKVEPLRARLSQIEQPVVVERMLQVAEAEDARMTSVKAIEDRLAQLSPQTHVEVQVAGDRSAAPGGAKSIDFQGPTSGTPVR
jgi:hypothetical protein